MLGASGDAARRPGRKRRTGSARTGVSVGSVGRPQSSRGDRARTLEGPRGVTPEQARNGDGLSPPLSCVIKAPLARSPMSPIPDEAFVRESHVAFTVHFHARSLVPLNGQVPQRIVGPSCANVADTCLANHGSRFFGAPLRRFKPGSFALQLSASPESLPLHQGVIPSHRFPRIRTRIRSRAPGCVVSPQPHPQP